MRLTKTQKNFRKQIKEIDPVINPYDYIERKPTYRNKIIRFFRLIVILFLVLGILSGLNVVIERLNLTFFVPNKNQTEQLEEKPLNLSQPKSNFKYVTSADSDFLDHLGSVLRTIHISTNSISEYHKLPWGERNFDEYRASLIEAIVILDKEKENMSSMNNSRIFKPLFTLVVEYISNKRMAYQYYLDYLTTNRQSDLDLGNKYSYLAYENIQEYNPLLVKIFQENGYSYTILDDDSVQYYKTKN